MRNLRNLDKKIIKVFRSGIIVWAGRLVSAPAGPQAAVPRGLKTHESRPHRPLGFTTNPTKTHPKMNQPIHPLALAMVTAMACAPVARGAVTYVEATLLNTNNAAGGLDSTWVDGDDGTTGGTVADGTATTGDGKWKFRRLQGSQGVFEASGANAQAENAPLIVTTLSGLADGTYDIYVFFRASTSAGENYNIKASLSPTVGDSDVYRQNDTRGLTLGTVGLDSASLPFAPGAGPSTANGDPRVLLYGIIGRAEVSGGGSVNVYIDDLPALGFTGTTGLSTVRTWYDGVGFQLVPEPSIALLGGLGAAGLIRRRRLG